MRRFAFNCSILAIALAATPAFAQTATPSPVDADASATEEGAPADIVVTAQLREERLQEVPVAITVLDGDALDQQGRVNLEGAVNLVPSFNFLKSGTTLNQSLFLRGVGTATFSIAGEPSVSTVVDGVVFSRSGEAFQDLVDIERLEVLRGPQGTLFGKNASAGVINIVTKRPTDRFEGYVDAGYFSDEEFRGRAVLNVPLTDWLKTRTSAYYSDWDGNITNEALTRNRTVNGYKHYGFRFQALADLSDTVEALFTVDWHKNRDDCCAEVIGTGALTGAGVPTTNPIFAVLPTPRGDRSRRIAQNTVTRTNELGWGASLQLNAELGGQALTSITAYRKWRNTEVRDGDFLPRAYVNFPELADFGPQDSDTISQEFRIASPTGQFLEYVGGVFYSESRNERTFTRSDIVCNNGTNPTPPVACGTAGAPASVTPFGSATFGSTFRNLAFFGNVTLNINDRLRLLGGLRYTVDQLNVFHSRFATGLGTTTVLGQTVPAAAPGIQPAFDQGVFDRTRQLLAGPNPPTLAQAIALGVLGSNGVPFRTKVDADNWSGRAGVQFDVLEDSMLYATYARGYKGPAYNVFFNLNFQGVDPLKPETSDAFEVGMKNTFFNGELVLNLAGFYAKYKNFQANNPDLVAGVVVTRFTNAGTVSTRGAELDLLWRPVDDLSISGGVAYTDAKVDQFRVPPGGNPLSVVPSGTPLAYAPKWKGSISADYRFRTDGPVDFFAGVQANYQSKQISQFSENAVVRQLSTIDSYALVNLQAGVVTSDDRIRVTAQVRNLFDQSFAAAIQSGGPGGSYRYQIPRDADRYYGVTARIGF
jgi:iron complex outermembrane recepter protein